MVVLDIYLNSKFKVCFITFHHLCKLTSIDTTLDTNNLQLHLDICTVVDDLLLVLGVPVPVGPDAVLVLEAPAEAVPAHGLPQTRTGEH